MSEFFDLHHTVDAEEIDGQGHVHNLRYLAWSLRAAGRHSASLGWDADRMLREHGSGWVVRSHEIVYRLAALRDDSLVVRTWVSDLARHAATRRTWICRPEDQKVLARVVTRWAMVDLRVRRAIDIPRHVASRITVVQTNPPLPWSGPAPVRESTNKRINEEPGGLSGG